MDIRVKSTDETTRIYIASAKDGRVDVLKQGNKRELNSRDEDGMSAVHWTAFYGHLDALRTAIGRGGEVDSMDVWGQTALHHAARNNHLNCVSFLVNFGCNMFALDVSGETAMMTAAVRCHDTVVKYLDYEMQKQALLNPKHVDRKRQEAVTEMEKRRQKLQRLQQEAAKRAEREAQSSRKSSITSTFSKTWRRMQFNERRCSNSTTESVSSKQRSMSSTALASDAQLAQMHFDTRDKYEYPGQANTTWHSPADEPETNLLRLIDDTNISHSSFLFDRPGFGTLSFFSRYSSPTTAASASNASSCSSPSHGAPSTFNDSHSNVDWQYESDPIHL